MEFVSARELRLNPKGVWRKLEGHAMGVVTINGKPSFLLTKLDPADLEEIIYIQNRIRAELALGRMRDQAARRGLEDLSPRAMERIIRKARRERHK